MIPNTTLFTKTRNRWRHFMQLRSNPDFMHGVFEMFSRVWRSIDSLCLTSGLRKNYAREVGIRSVPQYQISPNFLFWGPFRGGRNRKIDHFAKIRYGRGKDIDSNIVPFFNTWCVNVLSYIHKLDIHFMVSGKKSLKLLYM